MRVVDSPNAPRPSDPLVVEIADSLRHIENNYLREGSGPRSRFEGRLLEDVQAEYAVREVRRCLGRQPALISWGFPGVGQAMCPVCEGVVPDGREAADVAELIDEIGRHDCAGR